MIVSPSGRNQYPPLVHRKLFNRGDVNLLAGAWDNNREKIEQDRSADEHKAGDSEGQNNRVLG
jgi:hypothetical protein